MKKICFALLAIALSAGFAQAQDGGDDNYTKPILRPGRGALVFSMGGLMTSTPGNMDGIGAGGRYMISPTMAFRAGLGFRNETNEVDPDGDDKRENTQSTWAFEAALEFVLKKRRNMIFYAGPLFQIGGDTDDDEGDNNAVETSSYTLAGIAGVNWFFVENLSLGAEYRLGLSKVNQADEAADEERADTVIGVGSASILASFWF